MMSLALVNLLDEKWQKALTSQQVNTKETIKEVRH